MGRSMMSTLHKVNGLRKPWFLCNGTPVNRSGWGRGNFQIIMCKADIVLLDDRNQSQLQLMSMNQESFVQTSKMSLENRWEGMGIGVRLGGHRYIKLVSTD